jgi:hypothetical protein
MSAGGESSHVKLPMQDKFPSPHSQRNQDDEPRNAADHARLTSD